MSYLHGVEVTEVSGGVRPVQTASASVIGLVGDAPSVKAGTFPLNMPVMVTSRKQAADIFVQNDAGDAPEGSLPAALDGIFDQGNAVVVVVRVETGADHAATTNNVIGAQNTYNGMKALLGAESELGVKPRIIIAPEFSQHRSVLQEMNAIANRLRAFVYADMPQVAETGDTDLSDTRNQFTALESRRLMVIDPYVKVIGRDGNEKAEPASARIAGVRAQVDNSEGFWVSVSNKVIQGIVGTSAPVDFALGDPACRANVLNSQHITTIIQQGGYRIWGPRSAQKTDSKWFYESVVRTADIINDSVLAAHLWAVDRGINATYVEDVTAGVKAFLRRLQAQGAILGGDCWADPEINTPENIQLGNVVFDFDFTPPYPAERITFRSALVNDYIKEIF